MLENNHIHKDDICLFKKSNINNSIDNIFVQTNLILTHIHNEDYYRLHYEINYFFKKGMNIYG